MNVKKYLKKKAKEDLEALRTEKDREILQRLESLVVEEAPKKKRNMKWLWAIPSGALACAVATVLIVELVPSPNNDLGTARYEESNFQQEASDIAKLSDALTDLTLNFTEDQEVETIKFFDSVSGDEIYYILTIDENSMRAIYSMRFMIVVNDKYDYDKFKIEEDFSTRQYADYTIHYRQQIINDSEVNLIQCRAKIENAKYEMYVLNYEEYSLEDGMFLTVIDDILEFQ